jgi:hypothetical protein
MRSAVTTTVNLKDGEYDALWGGYVLTILNKDKTELLKVKTFVGIKCMNCPVAVKITNGDVEIIE